MNPEKNWGPGKRATQNKKIIQEEKNENESIKKVKQ